MGKSERAAAAQRRVAAQRAAQRAAERRQARVRRGLLMAGGSVGLVIAVVVALILAKVASPAAAAPQGAQTDAQVAKAVTSVSATTYGSVGDGGAAVPKAISGLPELMSDGKPEVLYMGGEFCPFCAAERWAIAEALSRFGTLTGLSFIHSAPDDGDIATLTFAHAHYASTSVAFTPVEWFGETEDPNSPFDHVVLQQPTSAELALFGKYAGGSIPFVDIGNRYVISGSQYVPTDLSGMSWSQIAAAMRDPSSQVAKDIDGAANEIAADIHSLVKLSRRAGRGGATVPRSAAAPDVRAGPGRPREVSTVASAAAATGAGARRAVPARAVSHRSRLPSASLQGDIE
jgi:hypothetical protein